MFDSFIVFNLLEGTFWIVCALLSLIGLKYPKGLPRTYWYVLSTLFFLFGVSDFAEAYYPPGFVDPAGYWLFLWKAICIIGLISCAIWYLLQRLRAK